MELVPAGLAQFQDLETGAGSIFETRSHAIRHAYAVSAERRYRDLRLLARESRAEVVTVMTNGSHIDALLRCFRSRERRLQRI
jgi:hypothetical protein